jgi:hypothetical protein
MQQGQTLEFRYQIALIAADASDPAEHARRRACVVRAARRLASPR